MKLGWVLALGLVPAAAEAAVPLAGTATDAGALHVGLAGYLQADAVVLDRSSADELNPSTGEPLNADRFLIRRARLRADFAWGIASARVELDGNTVRGPTVRLVNAAATLAWPAEPRAPTPVAATIGLVKVPFGFEVQERTEDRLFIEPGDGTRGLFPGDYDLGLVVYGALSFFRYQVAIMNGEPIGERQLPGRDPNAAKDFLGRLGVEVKPGERVTVDAGFSALKGTGFHAGTPSTKDVLVWRDVNDNGLVEPTEIQGVAGTPATPSENFDRFALGADLRLRADLPRLGELFAFAELIWATNLDRGLWIADPVSATRDLRERALLFGFTQELGPWFIAGARYSRYDPDAGARDRIGAAAVPQDVIFSTYSAAAAWRPAPFARLVAEYTHRDTPLGRAADGTTTTLAADTLTLRLQVGF